VAKRRIRTIAMKKRKNFFIFIIYIGWDISLSSKNLEISEKLLYVFLIEIFRPFQRNHLLRSIDGVLEN
jgi:hypothetical protein